jgi:hypothetical protein
MNVKRNLQLIAMIASGAVLLQFGGCVASLLGDIFFAVGPLLL